MPERQDALPAVALLDGADPVEGVVVLLALRGPADAVEVGAALAGKVEQRRVERAQLQGAVVRQAVNPPE